MTRMRFVNVLDFENRKHSKIKPVSRKNLDEFYGVILTALSTAMMSYFDPSLKNLLNTNVSNKLRFKKVTQSSIRKLGQENLWFPVMKIYSL